MQATTPCLNCRPEQEAYMSNRPEDHIRIVILRRASARREDLLFVAVATASTDGNRRSFYSGAQKKLASAQDDNSKRKAPTLRSAAFRPRSSAESLRASSSREVPYGFTTRRLLVTDKASGTWFTRMVQRFLSVSESTTPVNVTRAPFTMIRIGGLGRLAYLNNGS